MTGELKNTLISYNDDLDGEYDCSIPTLNVRVLLASSKEHYVSRLLEAFVWPCSINSPIVNDAEWTKSLVLIYFMQEWIEASWK